MPLLEVDGVSLSFGGLKALDGVSFSVAEGTIHGVIGPNGAGKTTLFNCISRLLEPDGGRIRLAGQELARVPAHRLVSLGLARTFQTPALCRHLSALENVLLGTYHRLRAPAWAYALRLPAARRAEEQARREALALLEEVGCREVAGAPAGSLAYGVLKRVELARALVSRPRLLALDEPAAGLTQPDRERLAALIRKVREQGITVLLVEHDMNLVMSLCDRVTVLDFGRVIADGTPAQVQDDTAVIAAYLGEDEEVQRLAEA